MNRPDPAAGRLRFPIPQGKEGGLIRHQKGKGNPRRVAVDILNRVDKSQAFANRSSIGFSPGTPLKTRQTGAF